ncbi:TPA: HNH endonuclease [Legionella pneumophila]|nr:HNH endonuclease [Legionella pneumophila]
MNDKIDKIKDLLCELEKEYGDLTEHNFVNFNALELPDIVKSVVDDLHPLLSPYEIVVYWYLFNNSIIKTGQQLVRASTRGMSEIAVSASGKSSKISYGSIKNTLTTLKEKSVISQVGDTTREGSLYKVAIPDEIQICQDYIKRRQEQTHTIQVANDEQDFYNITENRLKIFERDEYKCYYCNKQLTRFSATLDHIEPISRGGKNSFDNLVTACLHCNSERGNKPIMDYKIKNKGSL